LFWKNAIRTAFRVRSILKIKFASNLLANLANIFTTEFEVCKPYDSRITDLGWKTDKISKKDVNVRKSENFCSTYFF
jgi:hypothetical protein